MKAAGHKHNRLTPGFTLVELMVAVAVLAIMITIVATIVSECHKLVMTSQATMRANNAAGAIAQLLRRDIARISQNGFLCITVDDDDEPMLLYMTAGPASSILSTNEATGTLTLLGRKKANDSRHVLWRKSYLLILDDTESADWGLHGDDDECPWDFSSFQSMDTPEVTALVNTWRSDDVGEFQLPVEEMHQVTRLWQVLATHCTKLEIHWTNGDVENEGVDNSLKWYGKGASASPVTPMLWTNEDQNAWPKAIKISFELSDVDAPPDYKDMKYKYEIICPIGQ